MNKLAIILSVLGLCAVESIFAMNTVGNMSYEQKVGFATKINREALAYTVASAVCFGAYAMGKSEFLVCAVGTVTFVAAATQTVLSYVFHRQLN